MSGAELMAVVGCIAAVVSAYNDGSDLVRKVRERRRQRREALQHAQHFAKPPSPDTPTQELERSLISGKDVVQHEYDRRYRRFGDPFAKGDEEARDVLKNIIIDLQGQVIRNLKIAVQEDTSVNVLALQDISDESQDKAILCLMQLHQRLLVAAPISHVQLPAEYSVPQPQDRYPQGFIEPASRGNSWAVNTSMAPPQRTMTSNLEVAPRQEPWSQYSAMVEPLRIPNRPPINHQSSWITQSPVTNSAQPPMDNMEPFAARPSWAPPTSKYNTYQQQVGHIEPVQHRESWQTQVPVTASSRSSSGTIEPEHRKHGLMSGIFHKKHKTSTENAHSRVEDLSHQTAQLSMSAQRTMPPVPPKDNTPTHINMGLITPPQQQQEQLLNYRTRTNRSRPNSVSTRASSIASPTAESELYHDPWKNEASPHTEAPEPRYDSPDSVGINRTIIPDRTSALGYRSSQSSSLSRGSQFSQGSNPARHDSNATSDSLRSPIINDAASKHRLSEASQYSYFSMQSQSTGTSMAQSHAPTSQAPAPPIAQSIIPPKAVGGTSGFLPSEDNNFAGFCKGAWRLQIGERKKAFSEAYRPQMVTRIPFWKCTRCHYEMPMIFDRSAKNQKGVDKQVYGSAGILYRREFLFKCHVMLEEALKDPRDSTFGCIFCCAEGRGTPLFGTVKGFLAHMQEHRDSERVPKGEVMYRIGCVVGDPPGHEEVFDIALPKR